MSNIDADLDNLPLEKQLRIKRRRAVEDTIGIRWLIHEQDLKLEVYKESSYKLDLQLRDLNHAILLHTQLLSETDDDVHRVSIQILVEKLNPIAKESRDLEMYIDVTKRRIRNLEEELEHVYDTIDACSTLIC